jgi:ribonuclease Z
MYTLAAYSPATEKLFSTIERANEELATIKKETMEKDLAAKQKKGKKGKKGQEEEKAADTPSRGASPPKSPKKSAWDASDSESGWSTSDDEGSNKAVSSAP